MTQETKRHEMTFKKVVHTIPGMEAARVRPDVPYDDRDPTLTMDLYYPAAAAAGARLPAVLFVAGFPDPSLVALAGCKLKEMAGYVSWGQLVAASGCIGITYSNRAPVADLDRLLGHLARQSAALGIDEGRLAVWACSGNVPTALGLLMQRRKPGFRAALLSYGLMLDPNGSIGVARAAAQMGFANPCAGRSVADLPQELALMIVRAGQDTMPGLNDTIDRFVAAALACNLPLTIVNHTSAPHSFDLVDDSPASREVIREMLAFLRFHLQA